MKSPYVGTLVPNEVITGQFLVLAKEIRQKRTGEPYLSLHLSDRTGELEAKMWDNVAEVMHTFDRDDFVKVKGLLQIYQNRSQFTVHKLRRLEDHEVDPADYFPCSERDPEEMWQELQSVIAGIGEAHLKRLLEVVFSDASLSAMYKVAPAAKNIHHACRGGLIEHVISLCRLARLVAPHYKEVDLDLVLAGAILHDIGKVQELTYRRSFGYSSDGQLLGHIVLGLRLLGSIFEKLPDFPPKLRTLLEHMVISHHGELEFGSPKVPAFPEALLLHHLDNLDSKMEAVRSALKRDHHVEGEFTGWIVSLDRVLLKKDRYLKSVEEVVEQSVPAELETTPPPVAPPAFNEDTAGLDKRPGPPAPSAPEVRQQPLPRPEKKVESRPIPRTLFGEKLQAVLENRES
jgi:3'-5' exoribonuclease